MIEPSYPPEWMEDAYAGFGGYCRTCGEAMVHRNDECRCTRGWYLEDEADMIERAERDESYLKFEGEYE